MGFIRMILDLANASCRFTRDLVRSCICGLWQMQQVMVQNRWTCLLVRYRGSAGVLSFVMTICEDTMV